MCTHLNNNTKLESHERKLISLTHFHERHLGSSYPPPYPTLTSAPHSRQNNRSGEGWVGIGRFPKSYTGPLFSREPYEQRKYRTFYRRASRSHISSFQQERQLRGFRHCKSLLEAFSVFKFRNKIGLKISTVSYQL